jgi:hypothetical protein
MRIFPLTCILVAMTVAAICQIILAKTLTAGPPSAVAEAEVIVESQSSVVVAVPPAALSAPEPSVSPEEKAAVDIPQMSSEKLAPEKPRQEYFSVRNYSPDAKSADPTPAKPGLPFVVYYVYSELPPEKKPADIVLETLKDTPIGTPIEEIKRAADAFGLDFNFMRAVAKIESDFDPKQRTGSYIGLFQLNHYEFNKYGSGEITNPRDNAIAAAYKFVTEATLFGWDTHKKATFSDLYLIHQQGWQGAAEHVGHPERIAWKSMCATDEGREKGDKWCKRAIWGNTLPALKHMAKSVDGLTSGAFVQMWRERVDHLYSRYSDATVGETKH